VYDQFKVYCDNFPAVREYFDKNWFPCRDMWSDYARDTVFTAGNTTTNRVESNWSRLKTVMGKRTRIDKAVAALLDHQVSIIRQQLTAVRKVAGTSRVPDQVPAFLRNIASRLSDYTLGKVRRQWELFVNTETSEVSCIQDDERMWVWRIWKNYKWYECEDFEWKCSCLFYTSHHLPCQHVMHLAAARGFVNLPVTAIKPRWSMENLIALSDAMETSVKSLLAIAEMVKLKHSDHALNVSGDTDDDGSRDQGGDGARVPLTDREAPLLETRQKKKRQQGIAFVRLKRHEQGELVVLSSEEKYTYGKRVVEPLLQRMSEMSTVDFYGQLRLLEGIVDGALHAGGVSTTSGATTGPTDGSETDMNFFDDVVTDEEVSSPAIPTVGTTTGTITDVGEPDSGTKSVVVVMDTKEHAVNAAAEGSVMSNAQCTDESTDEQISNSDLLDINALSSLSQLSLPELHISDASQKIIAGIRENSDPVPGGEAPPSTGGGRLELLLLPSTKHSANTRTKKKQGWTATQTRLEAVVYPSELDVTVKEMVHWATRMRFVKTVQKMLEKYPVALTAPFLSKKIPKCSKQLVNSADHQFRFVLPLKLVNRMKAAVEGQREIDRVQKSQLSQHVILESGVIEEYIVTLTPDLKSFSRCVPFLMTDRVARAPLMRCSSNPNADKRP
jgi:hypothetical protein